MTKNTSPYGSSWIEDMSSYLGKAMNYPYGVSFPAASPSDWKQLMNADWIGGDDMAKKTATSLPTVKVLSTSALIPAPSVALADLTAPPESSALRAEWAKSRIIKLSRDASDRYFENGLLLQEIKDKKHYLAWEYATFDEAIDCLHDAGQLEYGARNARNFIAIAELTHALIEQGVTKSDILCLPISKLREICTVPKKDQIKLLTEAAGMDVSEIHLEAKKLRAKGKGKEVDPFAPFTLMLTQTMKDFLKECIIKAREVYVVPDETSDGKVLVDMILPEWFNSTPQIEAEMIEAESM